ncbi:MAG TPA: Spy/CpxP family protein refolding chaperone [Burkholderiales bacterium]|nr:Spy/CpxP family protein refolding chaperone [Burkholderiales bacterium]
METAPVPAGEPNGSRCSRSHRCGPRAGRALLFILAVVAAGFIGGYAAKSHAHGPGMMFGGPMMSGPMDPAELDKHVERMVKHFAVEVDATPEQQAKLTTIAQGVAHDLAPLRGKMKEARKQALDILTAPQIDRAAAEALRAEHIALADTVSKRITQALADAADVLTPEQRMKLAERMERFGHGPHPRGPHPES